MKEPLIERVKNMLAAANLEKDELKKNILKVLLGETQRLHSQPDDKQVMGIVRKMIESNSQMLEYAVENKKLTDKLNAENSILGELLPVMATEEEIRSVLVTLPAMDSGLSEREFIPLAFKYLQSIKLEVDNKLVIKVIKELIAQKDGV